MTEQLERDLCTGDRDQHLIKLVVNASFACPDDPAASFYGMVHENDAALDAGADRRRE